MTAPYELEAAIDDVVKAHNAVPGNAPLRVVIPSGNSHLAQIHAELAFPSAGHVEHLCWRVLPDDRTPSFVEIWLPEGGPSPNRVNLRVKPPEGAESPSLGEDPTQALQWIVGGQVICEATYHQVAAPTGRSMFLVALQPTARVDFDATSPPTPPIAADRRLRRVAPHA
jgi:hypothetical protein